MAERDIDIRVKVDAQGAIQVFDQLGNKVADFERKAEGGTGGLSKFQAGIIALNQAIGLTQTAFNAVTGALSKFKDFVDQGDAINDAAQALERLAGAAGTTGDAILSKMAPALDGSVDKLKLLQIANAGLIKGLNPEMFDEIAFAAKQYADATGIDAAQATDKFINAIARGRERQLEMLGLMKEGKIVIEGYTQGQLDAQVANRGVSDTLTYFGTALKNTYGRIAAAIDSSELLKSVTKKLGNELLNTALAAAKFIEEFIRGADIIRSKILGAFEQTTDTLGVLGNILGQISTGHLPSFQKAVDEVAKSKWAEQIERSARVVGKTFELELPQNAEKGADAIIESARRMADEQIEEAARAAKEVEQIRQRSLDAQADAFREAMRQEIQEMDRLAAAARDREQKIANYASAAIPGINGLISGDKGAQKQSLGQLGSMGGAALGTTLGPIGEVIGAELGRNIGEATFEALEHVFGGRDEQGKIRDSMDKFFADVLKGNPAFALIEGELKKITDLNFMRGTNAFSDGTFDNVLEGISSSAQNSFNGIGLAFSEMISGSTEQAGQLAAVLADNVGGSLNNLQVLVGATGKSFEDMRQIVVESFLDGEFSASKAQAALIGIQQISEKGIPGAMGDVVQAFHNLQAAGVQGGRYTVDALQDIGHEAQKVGRDDFQFVIDQLTASGVAVADVQKLIQGLSQNGIDDLKELTSATTEQLIGVLSSLEGLSFPFAEASKSVTDLISKVENLPDEIRTKVKIDVETNWGDAPTAVREAAQLPSGQFILDGRA